MIMHELRQLRMFVDSKGRRLLANKKVYKPWYVVGGGEQHAQLAQVALEVQDRFVRVCFVRFCDGLKWC